MSKLALIGCAGLMTDVNAVASPPGALRVADDVIIERPGTASLRPGFGATIVDAAPGAYRPRVIHGYNGGYAINSWDSSSGYSMKANSVAVTGGNYAPVNNERSFVQFAQARDNLYWSSSKGPYKITSISDTVAEKAGMHEAMSGLPSVVSTGTPVVLPTASATAWRWCFKKIDANGVETRSAPSPWSTANNTGATTIDYSWEIPLPDYVAANDQIELYRALAVTPATAIPSDQMYLAVKHVVTAGDVTAGYSTVTDRTAETALGAELYTNPGRDGALKPNGRPPASIAMTQWAGCMWFGGIVGPYTSSIDIVTVTGTTATDALTGIQRLERAGNTNTSTLIDGLASTTSIKVGQLVTGSGTPGVANDGMPINALVVSKTATTVTLSAPTTTSVVGGSWFFHDGITIDGLTYWASSTEIVSSTYPAFTVSTGNRSRSTARSLAYVISRVAPGVFAYAIEDPYYRRGYGEVGAGEYTQATVVIRSVELDDAAWTITTTCDSTSSPPAVQFTANTAGGIRVARDDLPHAAQYSKPSEPEHVPDFNYLTVGSEIDPILAFAPLPAALLVLKRDGIYRITGSAPDGWRVDCLEPGARILRGECVSVLDGTAFVLTERGVLSVNEGGSRDLTGGVIAQDLIPFIQATIVSVVRAVFVATWPQRNAVIVGVGTSATDAATSLYCYCLTTGAWSRWTQGAYCAASAITNEGSFFYGRSGSYWEIRKDRERYSGEFLGCDASFDALTWTNASGSATITITTANRGQWLPVVGDWVSCSIAGTVEYRRITAVVNGDPYTLTIASAFTAGAQTVRTAYERIRGKVQWQPRSVLITDSARARRLHVAMDWTGYTTIGAAVGGTVARVVAGMTTDRSPTATEGTNVTAISETRAARIALIDATPQRAVARANFFMPYVEIDDIGLDWRILGVSLDIDGVGERADR